jgi:hypothetical protein
MGNTEYKLIDNNSNNVPNGYQGTISYFQTEGDFVEIKCYPLKYLKLNRNHHNFLKLYNKLKNGTTHNFIINNWSQQIIDIRELPTYSIEVVVEGFLNIKNENLGSVGLSCTGIRNYLEIYFKNNNGSKRLMLHKDYVKDIKIGSKYNFTYEKAFGNNFYAVTDYELSK